MHLKYLYTATRVIGRFSIDKSVMSVMYLMLGSIQKPREQARDWQIVWLRVSPCIRGRCLPRQTLWQTGPRQCILTESRTPCSGLFNLIHGVTLIVMKMVRIIIDFMGNVSPLMTWIVRISLLIWSKFQNEWQQSRIVV